MNDSTHQALYHTCDIPSFSRIRSYQLHAKIELLFEVACPEGSVL